MSNLSDPKNFHATITPSDSVDFTGPCTVIKVLTAGDLAVVDQADTAITYAVVAGEVLQIRAKRVNSTGTTATAVRWWD